MLEVRLGKRRLHTHNGLLTNYAGADGMKTGFICDSGFNVVASATREGHKLIAVVLGETTGGGRTVRAANLLEHGFHTLNWKALFAPQTLDTMPIAEDAKGPTTMRQAVISYECGTGGRRRAWPRPRRRVTGTGCLGKGRQEQKAPAKKAKSAQKAAAGPQQQLSDKPSAVAAASLDDQLELASRGPGSRALAGGGSSSAEGASSSGRLAFRPSAREAAARADVSGWERPCSGARSALPWASAPPAKAANANTARTPTATLEAIAVFIAPSEASMSPTHRRLDNATDGASWLPIRASIHFVCTNRPMLCARATRMHH